MADIPKDTTKSSKIIIEGITKDGEKFRPSDWAERMSGKLSTYKDQRLHYSPMLCPSMKNGHKCVLLDKSLQDSNPGMYEYILDFARRNNLKIEGE